MARDAAHALHDVILDSAGHGGNDIPSATPGASDFPGSDQNLLAGLQIGSLADLVWACHGYAGC